MKLTKQPNFEISGVIAKNISISESKMNRVLSGRISFQRLWLVLGSSVTTGRFDFSVSLKSRQKQKHPLSIELETLCNVLLRYGHFSCRNFSDQSNHNNCDYSIFQHSYGDGSSKQCSGIKYNFMSLATFAADSGTLKYIYLLVFGYITRWRLKF